MRISLLPVTVLALSAQGLASALLSDSPALSARQDFAADYNADEGTWTGPIGPDNDIMTIQGTLEEVISQAQALANPGAVLVERAVINTRGGLAVSKTDCWPDVGAGKTPYNIRAPYLEASDAIDELKARKGNVKLDEPDKCERVACSGTRGAVFVCWEPVDGAPAVYEKPWSTVAQYAQGVMQQWCEPYVHQNSPVPMVGGKVWDPQGMVVYVKSDKC